VSARPPARGRTGLPGVLHRNLRQIRGTTWTLADAAGLRLAVCRPAEHHDCDPHLGTVTRDAFVGETIRIPVKLRNRSGRSRALVLSAEPLRREDGVAGGVPTLDPGTLDLLEAESGLVVIGVEVTPAFGTGYEYTSLVTVASRCCDPQQLRVRLRVRADGRAPTFGVCCAGDAAPAPRGRSSARPAG
jgi:hypothetical protein